VLVTFVLIDTLRAQSSRSREAMDCYVVHMFAQPHKVQTVELSCGAHWEFSILSIVQIAVTQQFFVDVECEPIYSRFST